MVRKFKVGDKVECLTNSIFGFDCIGMQGNITEKWRDGEYTVTIEGEPRVMKPNNLKLLKPRPTRKQLKQRIKELEAELAHEQGSDQLTAGDITFVKGGAPYLRKNTEVTVDNIRGDIADISMVASIPIKYLGKL